MGGRRKGGRCWNNTGTSDREYSPDEMEFLKAMDTYRRTVNQFPSPGEILAVARSLGYRRVVDETVFCSDSGLGRVF